MSHQYWERLSCYHISPLIGLSILYTISESQILISLNMKSTPDWGFRFPPLYTHTYICCSTNFPLYQLGRIPDKHINDTNRTHFWLIPIDWRPLIEVQGIGNWVKCQLVLKLLSDLSSSFSIWFCVQKVIGITGQTSNW